MSSHAQDPSPKTVSIKTIPSRLECDLGSLWLDGTTTHAFDLRNDSHELLTISSVSSSCGCIVPSDGVIGLKLTKGVSTEIPLSFTSSNFTGKVGKELKFQFDETGSKELSLTVVYRGASPIALRNNEARIASEDRNVQFLFDVSESIELDHLWFDLGYMSVRKIVKTSESIIVDAEYLGSYARSTELLKAEYVRHGTKEVREFPIEVFLESSSGVVFIPSSMPMVGSSDGVSGRVLMKSSKSLDWVDNAKVTVRRQDGSSIADSGFKLEIKRYGEKLARIELEVASTEIVEGDVCILEIESEGIGTIVLSLE